MRLIGGCENRRSMFPYPLVLGVTENVLNAGIPSHEYALRIKHEHGVLSRLSNLKGIEVPLRGPFWGVVKHRFALFSHHTDGEETGAPEV